MRSKEMGCAFHRILPLDQTLLSSGEDWSLDDLRDVLRAGYHPIVGVERHLLGYSRAFHAVVVVEIPSAAVTTLDPLDGPGPRRYGVMTFVSTWEMAGREALVIETPPFMS